MRFSKFCCVFLLSSNLNLAQVEYIFFSFQGMALSLGDKINMTQKGHQHKVVAA